MKILMSAFSCGPNQGSEPGIGWSWALEAARQGHAVTVITQNEHLADIDVAICDDSIPKNLKFDFFMPRWLEGLRYFGSASQQRGITWHIKHLLWQVMLLRHVRRNYLDDGYDFVHHITPGSIRHPTLLHRLPIPVVVGPLGGGERAPMRLRRGFHWRGWLKDLMRDAHTSLLQIDPIMHGVCRDALVTYAKTRHSKYALPTKHTDRISVAFEIGSDAKNYDAVPATNMNGPLRIFYAGSFLYWKGMHLGFRAIAEACEKGADIHLTMAGSGPEENYWRQMTEDLDIADRVTWLGRLPYHDMEFAYQVHDLFLFPSLRDSSSNVVLEALTNALPVICLDLGGPAEITTANSGRIVRVAGRSEAACVTGLSDELVAFHADRALIPPLREGAVIRADDFQWNNVVSGLYADVETLLEQARTAGHRAHHTRTSDTNLTEPQAASCDAARSRQ